MLQNTQLLRIKQTIIAEKVFSTSDIALEEKLLVKKVNIVHNPQKTHYKLLQALNNIKVVRGRARYIPSQKWLEIAQERKSYFYDKEGRKKVRMEVFKRYILRHRRFLDKFLPRLWAAQIHD